MRLPAGTVEVQLVHRQSTLLDDQPGLRSLFGQPRLHLSLVVGARLHREEQMMRRIAYLDPPRTGPGAGEYGVDRATLTQVAGHFGDPAREPLRRRTRLPQVVDVGVVDVLDTYRAAGLVQRPHGPDDVH